MDDTQKLVLEVGIPAIIALIALGFAAMSTNPQYNVPKWLHKVFFTLAITIMCGEGFYFWNTHIIAKIFTILSTFGLLIYLSWPLLKKLSNKNGWLKLSTIANVEGTLSIPNSIGTLTLTETLTAMHRRLVELQQEKSRHTIIGFRQLEKAIPDLADRMGTVKRKDWPKFQRDVKRKLQMAMPRRDYLHPLPFVIQKRKEQDAELIVAQAVKKELYNSSKWTLSDCTKISDWLDGYGWGIKKYRDNDTQWNDLFKSVSHYLIDPRLRELIDKHIDLSCFCSDVYLMSCYAKRGRTTDFLSMLYAELVGSPISPEKIEIALSEILEKIDNHIKNLNIVSETAEEKYITNDTKALINQLNQFIADRQLTKPKMISSTDEKSVNDWMQQNRDYEAITVNLFVSKFRQQITELAYKYREKNIINDEELEQLLWFSQPSYPSIDWTLEALEKYRARLK